MSLADVPIICLLILLIPKLVDKYLLGFRGELGIIVVLGGIVWVFFSCNHEMIYAFLGIKESDSIAIMAWTREVVAVLNTGNYGEVFHKLLDDRVGNASFVVLEGIFFYFTGGTEVSVLAINSFMAFWGSLTLTHLIYSFWPQPQARGMILPLFLIFTPSVVFWSSANLKEGLVYWSICQIFAILGPAETSKQLFKKTGMLFIGLLLGVGLRPHVIFVWTAFAVIFKSFDRRFWIYVVIFLTTVPIWIGKVDSQLSLMSYERNITRAENAMRVLIDRDKRSTFDYGKRGPVPVIDGAKNALFRPFPWDIQNLRDLLAFLEIWSITLGIFFAWVRMPWSEWRNILCNHLIQVSLLVCLPFFFFLTYTPNVGLIARQRVQMFPALLVLFAMPILQRRSAKTGHGPESIAQNEKGTPIE